MLGKTNATINSADSKAEITVSAINKTGTTITEGQKVWLNENQQTAGDKLNFDNQYALTTISRDGQTILTNQGTNASPVTLYSIGNDFNLTQISSFASSLRSDRIYKVKYGPDNSIFAVCYSGTWRIDNIKPWTEDWLGAEYYLGSNIFARANASKFEFYKVNLDTGEKISTFTTLQGATDSSKARGTVVIEDVVYSGYYDYGVFCFTLNDGSEVAVTESYTLINREDSYDYIAPTNDNLYIVSTTWSDRTYANGSTSASSVSKLRLIAIDDLENRTFRVLNQSEMQEDMQKWYTTDCFTVFNPYTGILTCTAKLGTDYGVYKYENGAWTTLPIDLGEIFTDAFPSITSGLMLSDDLSRATIAVGALLTGYRGRVINLTSTSGYAAVPYRFYNVTENTITGLAGNDTEPDGEVVAKIVK